MEMGGDVYSCIWGLVIVHATLDIPLKWGWYSDGNKGSPTNQAVAISTQVERYKWFFFSA